MTNAKDKKSERERWAKRGVVAVQCMSLFPSARERAIKEKK